MTAPTSNLQPIYNLPIFYVSGMTPSVATNTTLSIASGICRDQADAIDINIGDYFGAQTSTTVNGGTTGLNALDTSTLAASTVYALWAIADAANYNVSGFLLSTSLTAPVVPKGIFPSGYGNLRLVKYAITDATVHFIPMKASGNGNSTTYTLDAPVRVLNAGTATTQTTIDLTSCVPAVDGILAIVGTTFTPAAASHTGTLCTSGGTIANSHFITTGQVTSVAITQTFTIPVTLISGAPKIDYILTNGSDTLSVYVIGFIQLHK